MIKKRILQFRENGEMKILYRCGRIEDMIDDQPPQSQTPIEMTGGPSDGAVVSSPSGTSGGRGRMFTENLIANWEIQLG